MPRYAAKTDLNQKSIVDALRKAGVAVQDLSAVGGGCPDLAASFRGRTVFIEIKNPERYGKQRKPHASQIRWFNSWQGETVVVESEEAALAAMGVQVRGVIS
jgi:hypothetical protein